MDTLKDTYTNDEKHKIASEFPKLKDECYLDHTGATLYSVKQIEHIFKDLEGSLFGNPHAYNTSSKLSGDVIDQVRYRVLEHFNTNADEYSLIFTSGATNALKVVAETFDYTNNDCGMGVFAYLEDNHTSVLGMREYANKAVRLSVTNAHKLFSHTHTPNNNSKIEYKNTANCLFVYPAQSNFNGTKYPLSWIEAVQNGALNSISKCQWFCMLDAACFVSTNRLDLNLYKADFVCVSFYKLFGYPTGIGALLVRNCNSDTLRKRYFSGGTVQMVLPSKHVFRTNLHERFEDGTLPFLTIASLRHGFDTLYRLFGADMDKVSMHTYTLGQYVYEALISMRHANGEPVAMLYHDTKFESPLHQGGIVNFNLKRSDGTWIGYSEVLHMANLHNIHLRTGCLCNPGSCHRHLKLSIDDINHHFQMGHVCGDQHDLMDGKPTGAVRISFGYMSTRNDADKFLCMIRQCFIDTTLYKDMCFQKQNNDEITGTLYRIYIYPVKSCGAYEVHGHWPIDDTGLRYDRTWMVVNVTGTCLTQKHEPRMCMIKPTLNLVKNTLQLDYPGMDSIYISLEIMSNLNSSTFTTNHLLCQNKICGERVYCIDGGDDVATWLGKALGRPNIRLLRQNTNYERNTKISTGTSAALSLVNKAQFLFVNMASVRYLAKTIEQFEDETHFENLLLRFRANFVVDLDKPFIENECTSIEIGDCKFKTVGPCTRCQMICIDQTTGEKNAEPLRTLSQLTSNRIRFGIYLVHNSHYGKTVVPFDQVLVKANLSFS